MVFVTTVSSCESNSSIYKCIDVSKQNSSKAYVHVPACAWHNETLGCSGVDKATQFTQVGNLPGFLMPHATTTIPLRKKYNMKRSQRANNTNPRIIYSHTR